MYQTGLILEGGGMRGTYTTGVLDFFMDKNIYFSSIYGVSAGACHACSYVSKQRGRAFEIFEKYLNDERYCSLKSLRKTGDLFGAEMLYDLIPNRYLPFDYEAAERYEGSFFARIYTIFFGNNPSDKRCRRILRFVDLSFSMQRVLR